MRCIILEINQTCFCYLLRSMKERWWRMKIYRVLVIYSVCGIYSYQNYTHYQIYWPENIEIKSVYVAYSLFLWVVCLLINSLHSTQDKSCQWWSLYSHFFLQKSTTVKDLGNRVVWSSPSLCVSSFQHIFCLVNNWVITVIYIAWGWFCVINVCLPAIHARFIHIGHDIALLVYSGMLTVYVMSNDGTIVIVCVCAIHLTNEIVDAIFTAT